MTTLACDYSFARPTPKAIRAAGYVGVIRYLSTTPNKNLSAPERDALFAAGLWILLAWETTKTRATQGANAGAADAAAAAAQADALGYPNSSPVFFAVDEDVPWSSVASYFTGVASRLLARGVYGSLAVVESAIGVPWRWQSEAWSGSTVSPMADLYQRISPTVQIAGAKAGDWDEDVVLVTLPVWSATPAPAPPAPTPPTTPTEADMRVIRTHTTGAAWLWAGKLVPLDTAAELEAVQAAGVPTADLPAAQFAIVYRLLGG